MEEYLSTLPEDWKKKVKINNDKSSVYRFGDGKVSKATRNVITPIAIGHKQDMICLLM